jgi:ribosome-binding factor A
MASKPPSRRQEKLKRIIKEAVSDIIQNRLNDPRIDGFVTITEIEVSSDIRKADISISILAVDEATSNKTFIAIKHASTHIQSMLAERMTTRFTPILRFTKDEKMKKTLETLRIIEEAASEFKEKDALEEGDDVNSQEEISEE